MAHTVTTHQSRRECPRCSCKEALISTYHFGATHLAECKECGLKGDSGDDTETALARLNNAFYEYEDKQSNK